MSKFLTPLQAEEVGEGDGTEWILTAPLHYASDLAGAVIMVPRGFKTDFASTPRLPVIYLLAGNIAKKAAVVHDFLYSDGRYPRKKCDEIFLEACEVIGISWFQRWAMYLGVRAGGASHYLGGAAETTPPEPEH